jgi:hypothetical protein
MVFEPNSPDVSGEFTLFRNSPVATDEFTLFCISPVATDDKHGIYQLNKVCKQQRASQPNTTTKTTQRETTPMRHFWGPMPAR